MPFTDMFSAEKLIYFCYIFPILIISVTLHEFAHCWTDYRLGDPTAKNEGRITLNPLAHLDPFGTIMMVVTALSGWGLGWGKPAPFDPSFFRHPARDRMIGALAGPLSNILQMLGWASLLLLLVSFFGNALPESVVTICNLGMVVNGGLAAFNLLPIYPLDGHHILSYFAPRSWRPIIDNPAWQAVFLALVLIPVLHDHVLMPIMEPLRTGILWLNTLVFGLPAS